VSRITFRPGAGARAPGRFARIAGPLLLASACGPGGAGPAQIPEPARQAGKTADGLVCVRAPCAEPEHERDRERYDFREFTRSPEPATRSSELLSSCPTPDAALTRVAERIAARELREAPALEVAEVTFALRAEGAPYVWPRTWTLRGVNAVEQAPERLKAWLERNGDAGERRCGVASLSTEGADAVAAVSAGVLADLEALPTRVRVGTWLDVRARLLENAESAAVLVLGPRGSPQRVPAALQADRVRARFRADRPGAWLVQVLADVSGGPRPVAEALLFADSEPFAYYAAEPVPGEDARGTGATGSVAAMIDAARASEGLSGLARDDRLDRLALRHAEAMRELGRIAHDTGDGTPAERVAAGGVSATLVGENVAHARTPALAHRSLWASPSHRANLLEPNYDSVGIGVAEGKDGSLWVSELFAKLGRRKD
jgi:uncharacterized protein YkwD